MPQSMTVALILTRPKLRYMRAHKNSKMPFPGNYLPPQFRVLQQNRACVGVLRGPVSVDFPGDELCVSSRQ